MTRLPNFFKCTLKNAILLLPRLLAMVPMILFLIVVIVIIPTIFLLSGYFILATIGLPLALCQPISQMEDGWCKCIVIIGFVVCLPGLFILAAIIFLMAIILYPCLRRTYHHGIYDGMDKIVAKLSHSFIEALNCQFTFLTQCWWCLQIIIFLFFINLRWMKLVRERKSKVNPWFLPLKEKLMKTSQSRLLLKAERNILVFTSLRESIQRKNTTARHFALIQRINYILTRL